MLVPVSQLNGRCEYRLLSVLICYYLRKAELI